MDGTTTRSAIAPGDVPPTGSRATSALVRVARSMSSTSLMTPSRRAAARFDSGTRTPDANAGRTQERDRCRRAVQVPVGLGAPHDAGFGRREPLCLLFAEGDPMYDNGVVPKDVRVDEHGELRATAVIDTFRDMDEPRDPAIGSAIRLAQQRREARRMRELISLQHAHGKIIAGQRSMERVVMHDGRDSGQEIAHPPRNKRSVSGTARAC